MSDSEYVELSHCTAGGALALYNIKLNGCNLLRTAKKSYGSLKHLNASFKNKEAKLLEGLSEFESNFNRHFSFSFKF